MLKKKKNHKELFKVLGQQAICEGSKKECDMAWRSKKMSGGKGIGSEFFFFLNKEKKSRKNK